MQNNFPNDETPARVDVLIKIRDRQFLLDVASLQELFEYGMYRDPGSIALKAQEVMDNLVLYRNDEGSINELREDYDFLAQVRLAFGAMTWKEVKNV